MYIVTEEFDIEGDQDIVLRFFNVTNGRKDIGIRNVSLKINDKELLQNSSFDYSSTTFDYVKGCNIVSSWFGNYNLINPRITSRTYVFPPYQSLSTSDNLIMLQGNKVASYDYIEQVVNIREENIGKITPENNFL